MSTKDIGNKGVGEFVLRHLPELERPQQVCRRQAAPPDRFSLGNGINPVLKTLTAKLPLLSEQGLIDRDAGITCLAHRKHGQCLVMAGKAIPVLRIVFCPFLNDI